MTWLVFGVSCLLVLAGAVSIISGAPIIQLERGWAEVIAGAVALSSGGVVFALAGILMRLESIRDTVAAQALPVTTETMPRPGPITIAETAEVVPPPRPAEPAVPVLPSPPKPSADVAAPPAPAEDGRSEGLWKRVKRPEADRAAAEQTDPDALRQHGFPDRVVPDEEPPAPPSAEAPILVPAHPVPAEVSAPTVKAPPAEESEREPASADRDAGQIGWLERSLFRGRAPRPGDDTTSRPEPSLEPLPFQRPAGGDARKEPPLSSLDDRPATRAPLFPAPEPNAAAEPTPTPDLTSEQHGGAAVIGRYQAGSASYVMYSDGTIEVETEGGEIHRFGSMDELKAFIAQQDTTVS